MFCLLLADNNWSTFSASLGRDIHWTLARTRRAISDEDEINLYCSNFLVNSSVALECGNYLIGSSIIKAIKICTDGKENEHFFKQLQ